MFTQMINDFEEGMDSLKDVTKKNNIETKKALMNMEKKIDKLSRATKATPVSSVSSTGPVSSPNTSSKPSKAKEQPSKPSKEKPAKKVGKSLTEYQKKTKSVTYWRFHSSQHQLQDC